MEKDKAQEKAVALRYNIEEDQAPVVVAKGKGFIAQQIMELAQASGVPVKEDKELVDYLMALDLYEQIPLELYAVVAEVLAYIYSMNNKYS